MLSLSLVSVWEILKILSMQITPILFYRTLIFKMEMGKRNIKYKMQKMYMFSLEVYEIIVNLKKTPNFVAFDLKKFCILYLVLKALLQFYGSW